MPYEVSDNNRILRDPVTGQLFDVPTDEADERAAFSGLEYATREQIEKANEREAFGSGSQTALGALELAGEAATLGLYSAEGDDAEARRRLLRRNHPGLAFGAEAAGILPGVAAGALTGGALGAAGLGARAAAAASVIAEGGVSGFAQEQVQAREEGRDISVGNILMYGVGGEILGRAVPKVLGSALRRAAGPEDVLTGAVDNVLVQAERRALAAGSDVVEELPGVRRDRFLRDNQGYLIDTASERARKALDNAESRFQSLGDLKARKKRIRELVSADHRGQRDWAAGELAQMVDLRANIRALSKKPGLEGMAKKLDEFLREASTDLGKARRGADIFDQGDRIKRTLQKAHVSLGGAKKNAVDAVYHQQMMDMLAAAQGRIRKGLEQESLWGRAGRFQQDVNAAWSNQWFPNASTTFRDLARQTGKSFEANAVLEFDPAKIRRFLSKDKVGRGLTHEKLEQVLQGYEQMAAAHRKWGLSSARDLDALQRDIATVRKAIDEADEVKAAVPRAKAADQADAEARTRAREDAREARQVERERAREAREAASDSRQEGYALDSLVMASSAILGMPALGLPIVALRRLVRNIDTSARGRIKAAVKKAVRGTGKALTRAGDFGAPVATVAVAETMRDPPDKRFQGSYPTLTQSFQAKRQNIAAAIQNPATLVDAITESVGDLPGAMPDVHFRLTERMTAAAAYLARNLPPSVDNSLLGRHAGPPDLAAIRQFARLWEAVMNPGAVVADFESMAATPDQAKAIRDVHPDLYAALQEGAISAIAETTERPPWERMRYLAQMLELGPALGGVWKPSVSANINNSAGASPKPSQGAPGAPIEPTTQPPRGLAAIAGGPTSGG